MALINRLTINPKKDYYSTLAMTLVMLILTLIFTYSVLYTQNKNIDDYETISLVLTDISCKHKSVITKVRFITQKGGFNLVLKGKDILDCDEIAALFNEHINKEVKFVKLGSMIFGIYSNNQAIMSFDYISKNYKSDISDAWIFTFGLVIFGILYLYYKFWRKYGFFIRFPNILENTNVT